MNYELFNKIVIGIATIALSFTTIAYFVYFVGIGTIWAWVSKEGNPITATATVVLALTSIVVALVGFFTYFRENEKNRIEKIDKNKRDRLSVKPLLMFEKIHKKINGGYHYKFNLVNRGIGPAIIKNFVLISDDKQKSYDNFNDYSDLLLDIMDCFAFHDQAYLSPNSPMANGEKQTLWEFTYDSDKKEEVVALQAIERLYLFIEYQSIYEDETFTKNALAYKQFKYNIALTAKTMAEIHASCFIVSKPWTAKEFFDLLEKRDIFYIMNKNSPIMSDSFLMWERLNAKAVELITLAVIPKQQKKGFARALLAKFIAEVTSKGIKSIFIQVDKNNVPALHFFENAGFKPEGDPVPHRVVILMRLDINDS